MEELLIHKNDKPLWSDLDWLVNYKPKQEDKTPDWHYCKILGSYLGTKKDIENRKLLTLNMMRKLSKNFESKIISIGMKIRTFNIYIASIFLYNSETWGLSKVMEEQINAFQRRILRYAVNVRWPNKISNEDLVEITKAENWSKTICRRRLKFLGHVMRLDANTPIRKVISEVYDNRQKHKIGSPYHTWIHTIQNDLKTININLLTNNPDPTRTLIEITRDRIQWKQKVHEMLMQY